MNTHAIIVVYREIDASLLLYFKEVLFVCRPISPIPGKRRLFASGGGVSVNLL